MAGIAPSVGSREDPSRTSPPGSIPLMGPPPLAHVMLGPLLGPPPPIPARQGLPPPPTHNTLGPPPPAPTYAHQELPLMTPARSTLGPPPPPHQLAADRATAACVRYPGPNPSGTCGGGALGKVRVVTRGAGSSGWRLSQEFQMVF